jgi:hypothetical protein
LLVPRGSEDVSHWSSGGVSTDMSGRANAHTSNAAFRRPLEMRAGGDELVDPTSVASSPDDGGPKPPTKEVSPVESLRFLFRELLVDAMPALGGCRGWGWGSRPGLSPGPMRVEGNIPWEDWLQWLNSLMVVGR